MNSKSRRASWRKHDTKRKTSPNRKWREAARDYVRHKMKVPKSGICCLCWRTTSTVLHHESYDPIFLLELCARCHRAKHPRAMPKGGVK